MLFIYITRLASNEIFSPSNKIYREVGWAKDLSAPWYWSWDYNVQDLIWKDTHYYEDYEAIQSSWKMGTFLGLFSTNNYENNCFCKTHPRLRENKMLPVSYFISLIRELMMLTYTTLSTHQAQCVQMPKQMLAINCTVTSEISKGFNR
jgi:hypothetical protein